jgi:hypothetical protein
VKIPFALSAYKRESQSFPELRLRNMLVEAIPDEEDHVTLIPRPGLKLKTALGGASDVKAVWLQPGVFSNQTIALTGTAIYLAGVNIGTLASPATSSARFAASSTEAVFSNGGTLYRTDGVTVTRPTFLGGGTVGAVAILNSFFIATKQGTGRIYWSAVGDGTKWPALNFATAESRPDNLLDVLAINDQLALLGEESIEFWQPNPGGDQNLPFTRIDGLTYSKGVLNTGAAVLADNALIWVGNDGIVYRRGAVPQRISDHGIEEEIGKAGSANLFSFNFVGHVLLVLTLVKQTWIYDFATKQWSEASTYGFPGWLAQCGCSNGLTPVFGDRSGPNVLSINEQSLDDNGNLVERVFSAFLEKRLIIDNLNLDATGGIASEPSGDPIIVELTISRDGGFTFGPYIQTDLGKSGEYRKRAVWRRLGAYDMDALLVFRITDAAPFSVQSIHANEPIAGRGA